jgi:outer membrane protein X
MKSILLRRIAIAFMATATMNAAAVAQKKGEMAVGGNLLIGTGDSYTNLGIGAKFLYNVTDPIRLAGEFDFFPTQNHTSIWDLSAYGHYLFPVADKIILFPSVGLGLIGIGYSSSVPGVRPNSSGDFALSLGGGIDYELSYNLVLNGELRFKIENGSRLNLVAGLVYKF